LATDSFTPAAKRAILVITAVQFINVVDFMMVMPLGPDFSKALGIKVSHMGVLAGAYTLSAAVSGLIGSLFLDRLDRRVALCWSMVGLVFGTAAGAFATDFHTLLWARVFAGAFGGPTTSIGLAIISDLVPHERRGTALGRVMMGFSAASLFGVPIGLEIARVGGWNAPFLIVGITAAVIGIAAWFALPPMRNHLTKAYDVRQVLPIRSLLSQAPVRVCYALFFCVLMSGFLIFPNISAFLQVNSGFPRDDMGRLYFVGGIASLIAMNFSGRMVDKMGSVPWFIVGSFGFITSVFLGMYFEPALLNPYLLFVTLMVFGTFRNISNHTIASKVPAPHERAGFMSLQSCVQHAAMSAGGILSSRILSTGADGKLVGMDHVIELSSVLVIAGIWLMVALSKLVKSPS
jgi:predicted MFS family arabinose efflux permease